MRFNCARISPTARRWRSFLKRGRKRRLTRIAMDSSRSSTRIASERQHRASESTSATRRARMSDDIHDTRLRDIKPPMEIPQRLGMALVDARRRWPWWPVALLIALAWLAETRANVPVVPPVSRSRSREAETARKRSAHFATEAILHRGSDTVRFYLEERFNFRAPERTTEEFLHELQRTDPAAARIRRKASVNFCSAATS